MAARNSATATPNADAAKVVTVKPMAGAVVAANPAQNSAGNTAAAASPMQRCASEPRPLADRLVTALLSTSNADVAAAIAVSVVR